LREPRVLALSLGFAGTGEVDVAGDAFDPCAEEDIALAGLDRMERHPGCLHRGGAEAVDRGAGEVVEPRKHRHDAGEVGALLA